MLEFGGIIVLGIIAQWVAWRFKIPAILPLILIGLLVGPISTLFTHDATKLIEPVWNGKEGLFPGERLFHFVSISIGIILFEGGLTLKRSEIRNIGPVIIKLVTIGSIITFFGAGIAAHYIFNLSWSISFLFSSLVIVTGPTVISPILRNIPLRRDISSVLKWEGIIIDPIGALVAVLVFEFIMSDELHSYTFEAIYDFGKIVFIGFSLGIIGAYTLFSIIKSRLIPHYLMNVIVLAFVVGVFIVSDALVSESGLLAVVIMGMALGNMKVYGLTEILYFKESISILLISLLFILLSAHINIDDLLLLYNWKSLALFGVVILILRPLGVFLSTINSKLKTNEKLFISWVGPRGIVAAGIASLFGLKLELSGEADAHFITPLVFMIVLGTVLLNATTARPVSKLLKVFLSKSNAILIVGASNVTILIAKYLKQNGRSVILIDNNKENVNLASRRGLEAIQTNIYADTILENIELSEVGYLMAMTSNAKLNQFALEKFSEIYGEHGAYRLISTKEMEDLKDNPVNGLFSHTDDYSSLMKVVKKYPYVNEHKLKSKKHYIDCLRMIDSSEYAIPIFVKKNDGRLRIIPSYSQKLKVTEGNILVYIGKKIDLSTF